MEAVFTEIQRLNATTWLYLSMLLSFAVFFKFTRFFCLRNWDLVTLLLLAPGLLAVARVDKRMLQILDDARTRSQAAVAASPPLELEASSLRELKQGYLWLLVGTSYLIFRCLVDLLLTRRPKIDPNLEITGLACLGASLLAFLIFEAVTREPDPAGKASALVAAEVLGGKEEPKSVATSDVGPLNPGTTLYHAVVFVAVDTLLKRIENDHQLLAPSELAVGAARSAAILAHLLILTALVLIGWRHFGNPNAGMGMAALYLLTPLTAANIAKIDQLLPAALLIWAVYFYRQPYCSGALLGVSCAFLFPVFLIPLWLGFYGRRGAGRCLIGIAASAGAAALVVFFSDTVRDFAGVWSASVLWRPAQLGLGGAVSSFWTETTQFYRLPVFVFFMFIALGVSFWPREKNLADLIALSVLLILGAQLWYPQRGGSYIHWYLPLFLAMMFRPNLRNALPPEPTASSRPQT